VFKGEKVDYLCFNTKKEAGKIPASFFMKGNV